MPLAAQASLLTRDNRPRVVVVGAGVGGLSAALDLAAGGAAVTLVERQSCPGGKLREIAVGDHSIDAGPTVFTMRHVFDDLFAAGGRNFDDYVRLRGAPVLARHSWPDGGRLDLYADLERSVAAIEAFAGAADADAYRSFARRSQEIFDTLDHSFMRVERPGPVRLSLSMGLGGLPRLAATRPFVSLWRELGRSFSDARLRQLFGRYATYCGSSPFSAPATLMLIAHAERAGVWFVDGGMRRLADAMVRVLGELGVELKFGARATSIDVANGAVNAVELDGGESLRADAVVFNGDAGALTAGLLGDSLRRAQSDRTGEPRSLSAITWCMNARVSGFPLDHHNVFFGSDYRDEFDSIFNHRRIGREPTVYICAQDRGIDTDGVDGRPERLLLLINAPPAGISADAVDSAGRRTFELLESQGLRLDVDDTVVTTPNDFAELFPGSEGAIYGWPTHGWSGSFRRAGSGSSINGLFLAGGTVHPGPGVPMVALSGRIAANAARQYVQRRFG